MVRAILVGISDYSAFDNTPGLPCSRRDVQLMGEALVQGLHVSLFQVWVNTSTSGNISRRTFLEGIRLFLKDADPEDVLLFYFSGHGAVVDGRHYMLFSDGPLETQSLIDLLCELHVDKRILLLDCCRAGRFELSDRDSAVDALGPHGFKSKESETSTRESDDTAISKDQMEETAWISNLLDGGAAVFTAGRYSEKAGYDELEKASLFTVFLYRAMMNRFCLKDGRLSLDTIRDLVYQQADVWNKMHPNRMQHPVFRSSMTATVWFQVADTYEKRTYFKEHADYSISSVEPLHSGIAKRYAAKVVLKHPVTEEQLITINREIIQEVRSLEIYRSKAQEMKWKHHPADLIFTYFASSEEDLIQDIYPVRTIWADEGQDRNHWYRKRNSHVVDDICIIRNLDYKWVRALTDRSTASDKDLFVSESKQILGRMIKLGEMLLQEVQEWQNGAMDFLTLQRKIQPLCWEINMLFRKTSELPVPPVPLTEWSLLLSKVAGDVSDLAMLVDGELNETQFWHVENRFHEDLNQLSKYESGREGL